jgi:hypothetical protein
MVRRRSRAQAHPAPAIRHARGGRLIWNRLRFLKDPATGKRISRMNERSTWVIKDVPDLRIVAPNLWNRVQHRLGAIREVSRANNPDRPPLLQAARADRARRDQACLAKTAGPLWSYV